MSAAPIAVEVPDIGDFEDVPIIEILVSAGDEVAADDPLVTLESDKATMDVPAPFPGVVRELQVKLGDRVSQGTPLLTIERTNGGNGQVSIAASTAAASASPAEPPSAPPPPAPSPADPGAPVYASPSVRRLARELGVDLHGVIGSGRKGRIARGDVEQLARGGAPAAVPGAPTAASGAPAVAPGAAAADPGAPAADPAWPTTPSEPTGLNLAPWPSLQFEKFGPVERVPRSRIQRISAPNLARNWVMIPQVTQHDDADITELEAWRRKLNEEHRGEDVKVTMVSFLIVASVAALKEYPDFNSSLDGDELIRKRYYNIGFAADTPGGLVVPVIKDADGKGLLAIARELGELSAKARAGKLAPGDMSGSTFTISSLGGIGGTAFTPIVNAPEVAILGATRSAMKPVWNGTEFVPRLMLPLSLSYDHRVIDGAAAARFVVYLSKVLSDLRRVLL
jgi:pyruvate dehydrogenase E2 component (dihydrolipoamide acetyltransferase)